MNRFTKRDTSLLSRHDDEGDHERQTLIDNDELCDDEVNLFSANPLGIRNRQQSSNRFNKSISNMNNEDNNLELRNINRNKTRDIINEPTNEYTFYHIQPGDSLQSICLRYACSVNQVKRLNGLMTNQEFYGLRQIKLPLGKLGLLEDILRNHQHNSSYQHDTNGQQNLPPNNGSPSQPRLANSPGSALSVSTRYNPKFKPLLSPGYSSDRINEMNGRAYDNQSRLQSVNNHKFDSNNGRAQLNHSHSLSNLEDFASQDINIDIDSQHNSSGQHYVDTRELKQQSFIRADLNDNNDSTIDDLLTIDGQDNVDKVFQDLDYHVERAKVAAESYDQRAAELSDKINLNNTSNDTLGSNFRQTRVSKIPELFFCNENFGLSYKKLLVFIFIVCLVVPLVYINQTSNVIPPSHKVLHE